jgi:hypothetical protein
VLDSLVFNEKALFLCAGRTLVDEMAVGRVAVDESKRLRDQFRQIIHLWVWNGDGALLSGDFDILREYALGWSW